MVGILTSLGCCNKTPQSRGFSSGTLFSHRSGAPRPVCHRSRCWQPGSSWGFSWACWVLTQSVCVCVFLVSLLIKTPVLSIRTLHLWPLLILIISLMTLSPNFITCEFGGDTIQSIEVGFKFIILLLAFYLSHLFFVLFPWLLLYCFTSSFSF